MNIRGIVFAFASNSLFGVLYVYSSWLAPMSGTQVFAWRMVMMCAVLWLWQIHIGRQVLWQFFADIGKKWQQWLCLLLPTPILAVQLWLFMWAPVNGLGTQVAMGYFLFPLVMVLLAKICFGIHISRWQKIALALASIAVLHEMQQTQALGWATWLVCLGYPPYYLMRRYANIPAFIGLLVDLTLIAPFAWLYLALHAETWFGLVQTASYWLLLPLLGVVSALAMYLNLQANKLLPVPVFGLLSYLEPVFLFIVAFTYLGEPLAQRSLPTYALIVLALMFIWVDTYSKMKQR